MQLNERGLRRCAALVDEASQHRVAVERDEGGARIIDCGVHAPGGLEAGRAMAEVCLAGLGRVDFVPGDRAVWPGPAVTVSTDRPVAACLASQYAGWQVGGEKFFAMGSGPMRAAYGKEKLFDEIGHRERATAAIGILEGGELPPVDVCARMAAECRVPVENLTLLLARTASLAGTVQVVARSLETALHKLHELGFNLSYLASGFGVAPLPPVAASDIDGIGRTNDAVLYGGEVTLWVCADDDLLREIGPRIPSSASPDFGEPFGRIFERYGRDFYKIDPLLFSPAVVTLCNLDTGRVFRYGETRPDVLRASFGTS